MASTHTHTHSYPSGRSDNKDSRAVEPVDRSDNGYTKEL